MPRPIWDSGHRWVWPLLSHCAKQCTTDYSRKKDWKMDACQCHGFFNYALSPELNRRFRFQIGLPDSLMRLSLLIPDARQLPSLVQKQPVSQCTFCIQDESSTCLDLFWTVAIDRSGLCCQIVPDSLLQERIGKQMDTCQCHGFFNYYDLFQFN